MLDSMEKVWVACRHCGEQIERDADGVWVDVRFGEDEEPGYCAMGPYASHLPEREPGNIPY